MGSVRPCSTPLPGRYGWMTLSAATCLTSPRPRTEPLGCGSPDAARGHGLLAPASFLDEDARRFYPDWDTAADTAVAILRTEAGRDPHDRLMHDLVGELATRSEELRRRWSNHDVRLHGAGTKNFHHTDVGALELAYESVDMVSEPGLTLTIYAAEPASHTAQALALLGSLAASAVVAEVEPRTS